MSYERVIAEFRNRLWAVQPETFSAMLELMAKWSRGERFTPEEIGVRIREANYGLNRPAESREPIMLAAGGGGSRRGGGGGISGGIVALIPIVGVISNRASMFSDISAGGGTSVEKLTSQFRSALAQPSVKAIVFDIDSCGGSVGGVPELASEIYNARGRKKIISVCNELAASAAYWIGAAASDFVITNSGMAGSIGVFTAHEDHSQELAKQGIKISLISAGKFKTEGSSTQPLSDEARAAMQSAVDDIYQLFVRAVSTYRGDSQQNIRAGYGEGRAVTADRAVRANLADRIGTLDDVLEQLGVDRLRSASRDARALEGGGEEYSSALAQRRRQLALSVAGTSVPTPDDLDEESPCGCICNACKACTGDPGTHAGDGLNCTCACRACEACENKSGATGYKQALASRRRQLSIAAAGLPGLSQD